MEPSPGRSPLKHPNIEFISISFALSWGIVGFTIWKGDGSNSLHSSAQAWAFVVILATLAGFGLTAITDIMKAKSNAP